LPGCSSSNSLSWVENFVSVVESKPPGGLPKIVVVAIASGLCAGIVVGEMVVFVVDFIVVFVLVVVAAIVVDLKEIELPEIELPKNIVCGFL
jgi:hypothetical protein